VVMRGRGKEEQSGPNILQTRDEVEREDFLLGARMAWRKQSKTWKPLRAGRRIDSGSVQRGGVEKGRSQDKHWWGRDHADARSSTNARGSGVEMKV